MKNIPTHVYLQSNPDNIDETGVDFNELTDVTWTSTRVYKTDLCYVRHGLVNNFIHDLLDLADSLTDNDEQRWIAENLRRGCERIKKEIKEKE